MTTPQTFDDGVAVITGGSQGVGLAVAEHLADRGASGLVLVGRDADKGQAAAAELTTDRCRAVFVAADLASPTVADDVFGVVDAEFGRVNTLVNCAALTGRGSVWDTDADLWADMLNINVRAPGLLISAAARMFVRESIEGTVVLIGSVVASGGPPPLWPYSTSKGALHALTRNAAHSLLRHRIRVNLIQPGWMDTPNEDAVQKRFHDAPDDWKEKAEALQPWGRLVDPAEVARSVCFFATPESGMTTGAIFDIDNHVHMAGDQAAHNLDPIWGEQHD